MTMEKPTATSHSMKPGDRQSFANITTKAIGLIAIAPDGAKIRFNLMIGQRAEFICGNMPFTFEIHDSFDDLVGVNVGGDQ
jgi:hypothetical protein